MTEKGLREVVAADTQISDIDGDLGRLWYVGYDIADLALHASYEEIVYLLHHLDLPTRDQLDELNEFLIDERDISPFLANLMHELAQQTSPMSMLRTSISAASAYDPDGWDESAEAQLRKALRLIAKTSVADRPLPPAADGTGRPAHQPEAAARRQLPVDAAR